MAGGVVGDCEGEGVIALLQRASQVYEREKASLQAAALAAKALLCTEGGVPRSAAVGKPTVSKEQASKCDGHPAFQDESMFKLQGDTNALRSIASRKVIKPEPLQFADSSPVASAAQEKAIWNLRINSRPNVAQADALPFCEPSSSTAEIAGEVACSEQPEPMESEVMDAAESDGTYSMRSPEELPQSPSSPPPPAEDDAVFVRRARRISKERAAKAPQHLQLDDIQEPGPSDMQTSAAESEIQLPGALCGRSKSPAAGGSQQAPLIIAASSGDSGRVHHSSWDKLRVQAGGESTRDSTVTSPQSTTTAAAAAAMKMMHAGNRRRSRLSTGRLSETEKLEVYPVWQKMPFRKCSQLEDPNAFKPSLKRTLSNALTIKADDVGLTRYEKCERACAKQCHASRWTTAPNAGRVLGWNMFGMLCITYDLVMIPLGAFDVPSSTGIIVVGLLVTIFWTMDMFFRFFVGYNKANGLVERRFSRIACRYLRTWFALDMVLVVVDWLVFLGESGADTLGLMRLGKTLRTTRSLKLMRQARLLRLMKVEGHMRVFFQAFNSEKTATLAKMAGLIFFVVVCTHFVACGWYALTTFEDADSQTWVKYHLEHDGQNIEWFYLYSTSLHWSITQFTPASMEVYPHNNRERVANIVVVFFALVVFTSLVSSVTSAMTYLNDLSSEETGNKMKLRHWMSENSISMNLVARVWAAVRLSLKNKSYRMPMKEVFLLSELPKNVMAEVQEEVFKPVIADHPFFLRYSLRNRAGMRRIFNCTVGELSLDLGEELFAEGDPADRMFFIRSGVLYYQISRQESETVLRMPHRASYILRNREHRGPGDWCSEVALWAHWTYRGALTATNPTELLTIEGAAFRTVMTGFVKTDGVLSTYAHEFAEAAQKHWGILDIWCDKEVSNEMSWNAFQQSDSYEDESDGSLYESEMSMSPGADEAVNPWSPVLQKHHPNWDAERSPELEQGEPQQGSTRVLRRQSTSALRGSGSRGLFG